MVKGLCCGIILIAVFLSAKAADTEQAGTIRGMVYDSDFNAPLAIAQILIAETGETVVTADEGNYVFGQIKPGTYTLVFSKEGYTRQVKAEVVVSPGQMTEVNVSLSGEFTEMEEFVVQDVQSGSGTEAALLDLRMESPAMINSISADLMSQAGASDAASALNLVSGASVQDGKFAVIRGLPDRYVNSQMNGVRLPTADADKRAVQLDQFPSSVIDSIQISKTFTPDQQGDASGGAVNVVLKGIPDESIFKITSQTGWNSPSSGNNFLTYSGGGLNLWGKETRDIPFTAIGQNWDGAVGVSTMNEPIDYKWSVAAGGKHEFDDGVKIGGFGTFFYERDSSSYEGGIDDSYWVEQPGGPMTPQYSQGSPSEGTFKTSLFDVKKSSQQVQWGGLGVLGVEVEENLFTLSYMYTRAAEDTAILAEDTRGKAYYFPGYNPDDPQDPGNLEREAAPYIRTETLEYTERTTQTLQFNAHHVLPDPEWKIGNLFSSLDPVVDWGISRSSSGLYQPDKRQFGSVWWGPSYNPGFPPFFPPSTSPAVHRPFKPAANFTLGNLQRVWKEISEESSQYNFNLKLPFEQWNGDEGYFKTGLFQDKVKRDYSQDSFSNFNDNAAQYEGSWNDYWSHYFLTENHPITAANIDVDYTGRQTISAWYYMADFPLTSYLNIIGGTRFEKTDLSIINMPESDVKWIPSDAAGEVQLNPGDADVFFKQKDVLPSIGFVYTPFESITLRGSYSQTVARQTFKELSPIKQQEFLGGDVFIGNPSLQMSALKNYDLRLDYTPSKSTFISLSYFYKDIKDPIEYVQRNAGFTYTTPINYPQGKLSGYEIELRQELARLWDGLDGLSLGTNATFINSEVTLPSDEAALFEQPNIQAPMSKRDMTNAPEHLYNFFLTYDMAQTGTQLALFYTVRGDMLVAGAGQSNGKYIPNIYETEYGTLNFSLSQKLGEVWSMKFQAKNLLDPKIEQVYRSEYTGSDVTRTSYRKGMEFSIGFSATF